MMSRFESKGEDMSWIGIGALFLLGVFLYKFPPYRIHEKMFRKRSNPSSRDNLRIAGREFPAQK